MEPVSGLRLLVSSQSEKYRLPQLVVVRKTLRFFPYEKPKNYRTVFTFDAGR
jgi:hypothetical protein